MNKGTLAVVFIVVVAVGLGGFWYAQGGSWGMAPSSTMGTNGSPDQGNMGGTDTGAPQGDGTNVSQNLILGVNSTNALGQFLTAYNGMTLYTFTKDSVGTSTCYGGCAQKWPAYTVPSADAINVPANLEATNIGTIVRADGSIQVTYHGMPLYFWANDQQPGDTGGQGVGNVWFVAKP
jgi:predicted lipoprotein with Yx(FWY)xxD motif